MNQLKSLFGETKWQLAVVILVTVGVYFNSLFNQLVWDDHLFLENWPAITSFSNVGEIFMGSAPPGQDKVYRPLRGLIYTLDYQLFEANPFWYHLQALLIHLGVTTLVYFIVKTLMSADKKRMSTDADLSSRAKRSGAGSPSRTATPRETPSEVRWLPFVVALIFGIHPIHTETIDYIAASLETFGTLFFFGSFYLYLLAGKTRDEAQAALFKIGSVVMAILAFFTYEMTLILPILLIMTDYVLIRKRESSNRLVSGSSTGLRMTVSGLAMTSRWVGYLPYFAAVGLYLFVRLGVLHIYARTDYLAQSFYLTMLTMVKVFARYILLLLLPVKQTPIHNLVGDFPASMTPYDKLDPLLAQGLFDFDVLAAIVVLVIFVLVGIRLLKQAPVISFAIFWFFIALAPVAYIIPPGGAMAEKYLYIASFGLILAVSALVTRIYTNVERMGKSLVATVRQGMLFVGILVVVFYGISTVVRNTVWKNDITLFADVVNKSPNNLLANYTLGIWYANAGDYNKAIFHYQTAITKAPEFLEARFNLGNIFLKLGKFDLAENQYNNVLKINGNYGRAKNILDNFSRLKESTTAAVIMGNQVYVNYSDKNRGVNFAFPDDWSFKEATEGAIIAHPGGLTVEINGAKDYYDDDIEDYTGKQIVTYGTLVNQGLAQVPNVENAYVRVWKEREKGQEFLRLQFFLFKNKRVVEVMVYPTANQPIPVFDQILGSIKIE